MTGQKIAELSKEDNAVLGKVKPAKYKGQAATSMIDKIMQLIANSDCIIEAANRCSFRSRRCYYLVGAFDLLQCIAPA